MSSSLHLESPHNCYNYCFELFTNNDWSMFRIQQIMSLIGSFLLFQEYWANLEQWRDIREVDTHRDVFQLTLAHDYFAKAMIHIHENGSNRYVAIIHCLIPKINRYRFPVQRLKRLAVDPSIRHISHPPHCNLVPSPYPGASLFSNTTGTSNRRDKVTSTSPV